jgi:hypothetical protein
MTTLRRVGLALLVAASGSCSGGGLVVTQHVASVVVSPNATSIPPNGTAQLSATPIDAQGNAIAGLAVAWSSSSPSVAIVSSNGFVTGVAVGSSTIGALISGVQGTALVTVALPTFTVLASASPANGGTVSGAGTFNANSSVTVTATPVSGYAFVNWTEAGAQVSTSASYTFTLTAPRTLVANFVVSAFQLTVTGGGTGSGVVTSVPTGISCTVTNGVGSGGCTSQATANANYTLTATANTGSLFTGWSGDCVGTGTCVTQMSQNRSVTASFAPNACTPLALTFPGLTNGSLAPSGGCQLGGAPTIAYRFTVPTGYNTTQFSVSTAAFAPTIFVTADPGQNGGTVEYYSSVPGTISQYWALPPGTYRLWVQAPAGSGGAFSVSGNTISGDVLTGCGREAITVSVAISGLALDAGDCQFSTAGWYFDEYDIYSTLPCTITETSPVFAAEVNLRDIAGNQVGNAAATGAGANAQISLSSCTANGGPLRILATSASPGSTGAFSLSVQMTGQAASALVAHGYPMKGTGPGAASSAQATGEAPPRSPGVRVPDPR